MFFGSFASGATLVTWCGSTWPAASLTTMCWIRAPGRARFTSGQGMAIVSDGRASVEVVADRDGQALGGAGARREREGRAPTSGQRQGASGGSVRRSWFPRPLWARSGRCARGTGCRWPGCSAGGSSRRRPAGSGRSRAGRPRWWDGCSNRPGRWRRWCRRRCLRPGPVVDAGGESGPSGLGDRAVGDGLIQPSLTACAST
jgi:hypothetical protein